MKKLIITLLVLGSCSSAFGAYTKTKDWNVSEAGLNRAAMVLNINSNLSELQAQLLEDALKDLAIQDLEFINDDPAHLEMFILELEQRAPDDGDEHGTGSSK